MEETVTIKWERPEPRQDREDLDDVIFAGDHWLVSDR